MKAKIEVKKIVTPILEYFMISNLGHLEIRSILTPEQKRNTLVIMLKLFSLLNF
jgi:hypothetical protein